MVRRFDEDAFRGLPVVEIRGRLVAANFLLPVDWSAVRITGHVEVPATVKKSNSSIFQHIPGWIELIFQDISDAVYQTSVADQYALKYLFQDFRRHITVYLGSGHGPVVNGS